MTLFNICILIALVVGIVAAVAGFTMNKSSNFDDGSFIVQICLIAGGGGLVILAILVKFIASLVG